MSPKKSFPLVFNELKFSVSITLYKLQMKGGTDDKKKIMW
jgi:hypothetical protein